ncbi:MAG: hypothetical protein I8H75_03480 [Myxococcaceae bacterium]|nr:hypothetical protein [Myxococcaceae bacterium]MBH2006390.1 hypothetical protein [Myxococcaceae bacterium]
MFSIGLFSKVQLCSPYLYFGLLVVFKSHSAALGTVVDGQYLYAVDRAGILTLLNLSTSNLTVLKRGHATYMNYSVIELADGFVFSGSNASGEFNLTSEELPVLPAQQKDAPSIAEPHTTPIGVIIGTATAGGLLVTSVVVALIIRKMQQNEKNRVKKIDISQI